MSLCFVLVFEAVAAECASVLFLSLVRSQFFFGLELFGFLRAALAHIRTLELGGQAAVVFGDISNLPWGGGARDLCW